MRKIVLKLKTPIQEKISDFVLMFVKEINVQNKLEIKENDFKMKTEFKI